MQTLTLPTVINETGIPTGDDGVWALIHALCEGKGGQIQFAPGQADLQVTARFIHTVARALELAAACPKAAADYKQLAKLVGDQAKDPLVLAAEEGRAVACAACGYLWQAEVTQNGMIECPGCSAAIRHSKAAARAEEVLGVDGPATQAAAARASSDVQDWF